MPVPKKYEIDNMAQEAETITDARFGDLARTPKGRTTLRAILEATYELATSEGLLSLVSLHYDLILKVDDAAYFETLSIWIRKPAYRRYRDSFQWRVCGYYADLLQAIHPEWDEVRCSATAFQLFTLVLGGWQSLGSSSAMQPRRGRKALKAILLDGIERLIV